MERPDLAFFFRDPGSNTMANFVDMVNQAGSLLNADQSEEALQLLETVLQTPKINDQVRIQIAAMTNKAECLSRLGRVDEAIAVCGELLEMEINEAQTAHIKDVDLNARIRKSCHLDAMGDPEGAIDAIRGCFALFDDAESAEGYTKVMYNMAASLSNMGKMHDAKACFDEVLRLNPEFPGAEEALVTSIYNIGVEVLNCGQEEEACDWFEQVLERDEMHEQALSGVTQAQYNQGVTLLNEGNPLEAYSRFHMILCNSEEVLEKTGLRENVTHACASAGYNIGVAYLNDGKYFEARDIFEENLEYFPDHAESKDGIELADHNIEQTGMERMRDSIQPGGRLRDSLVVRTKREMGAVATRAGDVNRMQAEAEDRNSESPSPDPKQVVKRQEDMMAGIVHDAEPGTAELQAGDGASGLAPVSKPEAAQPEPPHARHEDHEPSAVTDEAILQQYDDLEIHEPIESDPEQDMQLAKYKLQLRYQQMRESMDSAEEPLTTGLAVSYALLNLYLDDVKEYQLSQSGTLEYPQETAFSERRMRTVHYRTQEKSGKVVKQKYTFVDVAPSPFEHLRQTCGMTLVDYIETMCASPLTGGAVGEGKSGQFFFFASDKTAVIKTVTNAEWEFMMRILQDYHRHMTDNVDTSLMCRFYALYKVKMKAGVIRLVVMNNIFQVSPGIDAPRNMKEMYDLKGSFHNRLVTDEQKEKGVKVMKDNNWKNSSRKMHVEDNKVPLLQSSMRSDVDWLEEHHIMDYSLLLGISDKPTPDEEQRMSNISGRSAGSYYSGVDPGRTSIWKHDMGGLKAIDDEEENYYFGIIDILQEYNMKKKVENAYKTRLMELKGKNPKDISAVSAKDYGERFMNFMECEVIAEGDEETRSTRTSSLLHSTDQEGAAAQS